MRKVLYVALICLLIVSVSAGCGLLQKLGFNKGNDEIQPASSIVMNEDEARKLTDKVPVHLYFATADNMSLRLEVRYIPVIEAKKSVNNLASIVVKELIAGPTAGSGLKATIPAGTQLRGPVGINTGVATVDLSKEFIDKHPGGKIAEQLTIYSIVNSLTEIKEIQKVKFTINAKAQKDFKGNFQFDTPFPRSDSIISKVPPASGTDSQPTSKDIKKPDDKNKPADTKQTDTKKEGTKDDKTAAPKPGDNKPANTSGNSKDTSAASKIDEDAEATYLEILE